jgi:hypothetical protein
MFVSMKRKGKEHIPALHKILSHHARASDAVTYLRNRRSEMNAQQIWSGSLTENLFYEMCVCVSQLGARL